MGTNVVIPDDFYTARWEQAGIPIKFQGMRLADYSPSHKSAAVALAAARNFIDNFPDHYVSAKRAQLGKLPANRDNIGRGLLFFGRNGTRKSTLAAAVITEIQYLSPSYRIGYIRFSDWKKALTDSFEKEEPENKEKTENKEKSRRKLKLAALSHILVLDDLGQEHRTTTGFTEKELHELLRVRYEAAKPTIVTTNIDPDFMQGIYGDSFESFRHDAFDTYPILGPDTRKAKE